MNCNCMAEVDEKLSDQNLALDRLYLLTGSAGTALYIGTHFKNEEKRKRGDRTTKLMVSFCPFCGKKATDDTERAELREES